MKHLTTEELLALGPLSTTITIKSIEIPETREITDHEGHPDIRSQRRITFHVSCDNPLHETPEDTVTEANFVLETVIFSILAGKPVGWQLTLDPNDPEVYVATFDNDSGE